MMKKLVGLLIGVLLLSGLWACDNKQQYLTPLRPNDVILAFGDSLTKGVGAAPELSYPAQLSRLIARKVINAGISGETSGEGARRLPGLLDDVKPELVIICEGGNDILRKQDRGQLLENLRRMYEAAHQRDIQVVMIAVPQMGLLAKDLELYRELADELKFPLLEDRLGELLFDRTYKSDAVHLNAQGYRKLAEAVADLLKSRGAI